MAVYLVTWDLNNEADYRRSRTTFINHLNGFKDAYWDSRLRTVRFINTPLTSGQIYNHLVKALDKSDRIFVTEVEKYNHTGWLDQNLVNWLKARGY